MGPERSAMETAVQKRRHIDEFDAKRNAVKYLHRAIVEELKLTDCGLHAFRRNYAHESAKLNGLIATSHYLGHASIKTTEIYIQRREATMREVAEAVAEHRRQLRQGKR